MKKLLFGGIVVVVVLMVGFFAMNSYINKEKQAIAAEDYRNGEYVIEGERVKLEDGVAESDPSDGSMDSASVTVTRYFGNEVHADLNSDGRDDVAFILTQESGGSGTFYYLVAALNTEAGYVGSQAILIGDRIAPQTTELSANPDHENVLIVNYADRAPGEPMSAEPTVGKSMWLVFDPEAMQFGEVEHDFEGEADPSRMSLDMKTWVWVSALYNDGTKVAPRQPGQFTLTFEDGRFSASTDCNSASGSYTADDNMITFAQIASTKMFCQGSQETEFFRLLENTQGYHFTSHGELILDLKFDSGTATFR
jgi:heat shock protein HslJ